jgi:hypothetical protein
MPSITLDVVIGLVFVYVLLSLIGTALTEWVARMVAQRSKTLEAGIQRLLDDPAGSGLAKDLYEHPLIKALFPHGQKPSYLPSQQFAIALMDLLGTSAVKQNGGEPIAQIRDTVGKLPEGASKTAASDLVNALAVLMAAAGKGETAKSGAGAPPGSGLPTPGLLQAIAALVHASGGDLDTIRKNIENWFDNAMQRVSGWYKRWAQLVTLGLGLVVVVGLNADSVMIANGLSRDPVLREALVTAAGQASQQPLSNLDLKKIESEFTELNLTIGWSTNPADPNGVPTTPSGVLSKIVGLLLTAVAISFGAPFWFDALNKLVNLRATGDPPPVSKPEKPSP